MQCSCCGQQRDNLRECSRSAIGANNRKTIATLQLCAVCRILYRIKPQLVISRTATLPLPPTLTQRVA